MVGRPGPVLPALHSIPSGRLPGSTAAPRKTAGTAISDALTIEWDSEVGEPFTYVHGTPGRAQPDAMVFGAIGDFHDTSPDVVEFFEKGLRGTSSMAGTAWNTGPGDGGGWLRCLAYTPVVDSRALQVACSWADKGSLGTVVVNEEGLDDFDDAQAVFRILDDSRPPAVVTLAPGRSAYAAIGLTGDTEVKDRHKGTRLTVHFSAKDPSGSTGTVPDEPALPADTYWDEKGFVTYWQSDMADALTY
ncbi:hypothetical protein ACFU6I_14890 [Streptomyces sp. NPDC057486]|uniref:hypothetical protein n=1 Tax=Streptomyces sp. NPDC057486 TaxID=3346145 RepID=UPI0036B27E14